MTRIVRAATLVLGLTLAAAAMPDAALAQSPADSVLAARVESALDAASDLPADSITVSVRGDVVTLTGSLLCAECGGNNTPGGTATIQQGLGALVRAVPGVRRVVFDLVYERPQ